VTIKISANHFAYASLVCSLLFWSGLVLSYFPSAPKLLDLVPGVRWLAIQGVGVVLGVVAAVLDFRKKLWILAVALALVTFFFVMYVIGS
jgi:hypothetical protein